MVLATARPQIRMCGVLSALSFLALTGPHISLSVRLTFTTAPLYHLMAPGTGVNFSPSTHLETPVSMLKPWEDLALMVGEEM